MRIVSLLPSATEILFALGAGDDVVGVTFECDFPPEARSARVVSVSTLPEGLDPASIDAAVAQRKAAGEDIYRLDRDALAGLDADLVITQDLCAVCAVDVANVEQALKHLGSSAEVLTIDPQSLSEVLESIRTIGTATGTTQRAEALIMSLTGRLEEVRRLVDGRRQVPTLVLEWTEPPFAPGHWVPDMISGAGGGCVLGTSGADSFRTSWDVVASSGAEVVVSAPCGFNLDEATRHSTDLLDRARIPSGVPLWAADANAVFARPGPRLVDGVEALASILHPEVAGKPDPAVVRCLG